MADEKWPASALAPPRMSRQRAAGSLVPLAAAAAGAAPSAPSSPSADVVTPDELEELVTALYAALDRLAARVGFDIEERGGDSDVSDGEDV